MDSPEHSGNYAKRDIEENLDVKRDRAGDGEGWEGGDKRKHRSSKSRKHNRGEDIEVEHSSSRRKSSGDRSERRKSSGGKGDSDDDNDYGARKESHYKESKKKQEESSLEKLSNWYQDGELDNRQDGGDKSSSRAHGQADKNERRKIPLKSIEHESLKSTTKNREEKSWDEDFERTMDRDSKNSERWESSREKSHGDQGRNTKRRWDEPDVVRKVEESHYEKAEMRSSKSSDLKYESSKKRTTSSRIEPNDIKSKSSELNIEKGSKTTNREEKRSDAETSKSKGRSEALEEDIKASPNISEDRLNRDRNEKARHHRSSSSRDVVDGREKSFKTDENENTWTRDRSGREVAGNNDRSGTPERVGRRQQETEHSEMEYDRSGDLRRKELEKDVYRDDRSKGRDDGWSDKSRDWEGYRENWKRRQAGNTDKGSRDGDNIYDRGRDWEFQRHGRERFESERHHGRTGSRKDGSRGEVVKASSNFGHVNYDVIEIQTKPIDYTRVESTSSFARRSDLGPQSDVKSLPTDDEWAYAREDRARGSDASGDDLKERSMDDGAAVHDPSEWRDDMDGKGRGQKSTIPSRSAGGQNSSGGSQPPYGNHEQGSLMRAPPQGMRGSRGGRGGRVRSAGRDSQQAGLPPPMMGSPFGPLGMPPPGPMQPLNPNMSPAPGPPISPGVFIQPYPVWPGARGVDMNILGVPPGLSPVSSGPSGPRYPPNLGNMPNPAVFFNQSGPGRGVPPNTPTPNFNASGPAGRSTPEKSAGGWVPPRNNGLPGKAPSRGEQNDYSQNFVDTGMRPQNFIRELELTNVEDYPKLRELIQKKDEIVANSASPPMYFKCDLKEFELSPEFFGTKFDVILVDPPWEEYVHRAPGVADHMEYWTFEEILNLKIEAIADTPSFIFLWVGDGVGLEQGRQCLKKWGFRRCEDICWVKTNKTNAAPGLRHDSHTLFQHSKEHCLMGIKGTVRRSTDGHIIHANIDTDVIIAEEPPYGSTRKPEDMYRIIEHFALGRRRLELFGEDHNIRSGWLTVGKGLSSSNFNTEAYIKNFSDKDGKVWQGGGGRNPPPEAPHLVLTTPEIESLRPKSPMKNQQQLQHQQSSISLTTANSSNRRATGNSPQNPTGFAVNQESSSSNSIAPAPWGLPMEGFRGREGAGVPSVDKGFEMYGYGGQASVDYMDFESQRAVNLL